VAACQSLLRYFGIEYEKREDNLAKDLNAGPDHGTKYKDIARVLKESGMTVDYHTGWTIEEVKKEIDAGNPVLVCYQAWVEWDNLKEIDWANRWDDGHYSLIVGYSAENFFFMDPSTLGSYAYIPISDFVVRWHDFDGKDLETGEKLVHWGLTAKKECPKDNKLYLEAQYLG